MRGMYSGASRSLNGDLIISFIVDDEGIEEIKDLEGKELVIDISTYKKKRSLNANNYLWKLCDEIAKRLGSDKETIYLMKLRDAGVYESMDIPRETIPMIEPFYKIIDVDHFYQASVFNADGEENIITMASIHCYKGSHEYDTKQMSDLIDSTVNDAKDLGISTWTQDEINHMCSLWKAQT